ncbi:MAG: UGMP family protein, partial [Candidatus Aenigmatarchaeota archaeon]
MKVLGIESTAHTFGIGVVDENGKILADERDNYKPEEGIVPDEAANFHRKNSDKLLKRVKKKISFDEIDLIGISTGPGLPPCLEYGFKFAGELSKKLRKPLIGVNHCQAHIEIGKFLTKAKDPIILYVSGGNTQVIYENRGYRVLGETQDIGIGNAIDKLGRAAGLKFPAGPKIEKIAKNGKFVLLPY